MGVVLAQNTYGKNAVNLSKVIRHNDYHEFRQISVDVSLQGDFETAYTLGDNSKILATDTQKNTVYALAKEHFNASAEGFGLHLAHYFKSNNPQVSQATIEITEHGWSRMSFNGETHPHAYSSNGNEKHMTTIVQNSDGVQISSGIKHMLILKTTDSGFEHFIREKYTTLKETNDRIFATECEVSWIWNDASVDFSKQYEAIRTSLLKAFAFHKSLSVQQTLYAMGEAVLNEFTDVKEISLSMPNKHHILYNLEQFGMENKNDIFIATDEPFGYITGTIKRS
ncbi:MAG: factor-independent urate hydroxylase [Bacteroidota bacterium]